MRVFLNEPLRQRRYCGGHSLPKEGDSKFALAKNELTISLNIHILPYEEYFDNEPTIQIEGNTTGNNKNAGDKDGLCCGAEEMKAKRITTSLDHRERHTPWKYYCRSRSPHNECIYA